MNNNDEIKPQASNKTDHNVKFDLSIQPEGIIRPLIDLQEQSMSNEGFTPSSNINPIKVEGVMYPIIDINNRPIKHEDILSMRIYYDSFLPTIFLKINDRSEVETRISSTQMSGLIKLEMFSPIDKVYKKILLNFRITDVNISSYDNSIVSYTGVFYVPGFKDTKTMLIYKKDTGKVNANTYEMLYEIAKNTGLGFSATDECENISDRIVRHIPTQRYDDFIISQLKYSGTDINNIFDAWVDLYGYIVLVNVPWVLNQQISISDLKIISTVGLINTSYDLDNADPEPVEIDRILTNYNLLDRPANILIKSAYVNIDNSSIIDGTLERIYSMNMMDNGRKTKIESLDIQTKQNSLDGEFLEDYNTGKNRPMPKFNFNDDKYTGLEGGYNIHIQERIRESYFKKLRQSTLTVEMEYVNFGLQRGTLIYIAYNDDKEENKNMITNNMSNLSIPAEDLNPEADNIDFGDEYNKYEIEMSENLGLPSMKLSGFYYIDGMEFYYSAAQEKIVQKLILIKNGDTSGYINKHTITGITYTDSMKQQKNDVKE